MTSSEFDVLLKVVEFITLVGGGAVIFIRLGRTAQKFDQHSEAIMEMKTELKGFREVVTTLAVQDTRMNAMQEQLTILDKRYEELRHGEGMVFPVAKFFPTQG